MTGAGRPLRGQSFYLDMPSGRSARELARAIRHLGGVTESFLSKEVTYVVSSNKEAKRDKARTRTEKWSNVTSEGAKAKSPVPSASKGSQSRAQQKPPDTQNRQSVLLKRCIWKDQSYKQVLISRGRELLQKAIKNQDTCGGSGILASARLWGVQIVHVDEMLSYAQQLLNAIAAARKRSQKAEAKCLVSGSKVHKGTLKLPFLKVEDQSRQFRPFYRQFKSFPDLNFLAPKNCSPFEPLKSLSNSCRARDVEGCPMRSEGEKSPPSTPVTVPKRKRGFCECCQETFEELQNHLQSLQHKQFALDDSQYAPVDDIISQLNKNFVEQLAKVPWSCLTDEHLMPRARVTRGNEMLTTELGRESQQAPVELVIDADTDLGPKMRECSTHLPGNRVRNLRNRKGLSGSCSLGLPAGSGLGALCAVQGTADGSVVAVDTDSDEAPGLGQESHVEAAQVGTSTALSEPRKQQMLGPVSHLLQELPAARKRPLCGQGSQVEKKPRLELGAGCSPYGQTRQVGSGAGVEHAGHRAGSLSACPELSCRPCGLPALELCPCRGLGEPAAQPPSPEAASAGLGAAEVAAASAIGQEGSWAVNGRWVRKQLKEEEESAALHVGGCGQEGRTSLGSCPAHQLPSQKPPVPQAGCCCSLCVRAARNVAPELPELPGHSREWPPCPGLPLPHSAEAEPGSGTASDSNLGIRLLSTLTGVQSSGILPVDRDLLPRMCTTVRDSGFESQLCSTLKWKPELNWMGKVKQTCWNWTESEGTSSPVSEISLGDWSS